VSNFLNFNFCWTWLFSGHIDKLDYVHDIVFSAGGNGEIGIKAGLLVYTDPVFIVGCYHLLTYVGLCM